MDKTDKNTQKSTNIMLVAGEPSGDAHAARLVKSLEDKKYFFYGMGGVKMQAAGVELIENIQKMSVMGIFELFGKLPHLYKILFRLKKTLKKNPPDLLILIDYQAFNLKLVKTAKKLGIKTLFYIGPQVWAWRQHRVKKIKKIVDHMAVIFPFEVDFYKKHNIRATYVGHPLIDGIKINLTKDEFLKKYQISNNKKIIAFLPGSRSSEINNHMPIFKRVVERLGNNSSYEFLISKYHQNNQKLNIHFENLPKQTKVINADFYEMINAADFVVAASGTATLETILLRTPMVMVVKVSKLSYLIYKKMIKTPFIAIVNIIAGRKIVTELVQKNATADNLIIEIESILTNKKRLKIMQADFNEVLKKLSVKPNEKLSDLVLKLLKSV